MLVNVHYFKKSSGKYYASGSYEAHHEWLFQIVDEFQAMLANGQYPGVSSVADFIILLVPVAAPMQIIML